jgi:parallel beta-helix repeat protein
MLGIPNLGESGAPGGNGVTNVPWYIAASDDVNYSNKTFWTKDITVNSSGKMNWYNITAIIDGDVQINSNSYFNLTDCILNLSGNLNISGEVNLDNVILIMNSSSDGEFGIDVKTTGTFNVLNKSNITAYNKTAPIDLDTSISGPESWGLHYNFTVHGNLKIDQSYISYTYGNLNYYGGVHLYETSNVEITNSVIYENEIAGIYAEGDTEHSILNNHIYNSTAFGIYLYDQASPTIDNNTIETFVENYGMGIVCDDHCDPKIYRNTITNNRYDGIFLVDYSNATIWNNTISNNQRVGIFLNGRVTGVSPPVVYATICNPVIQDNDIIDNYEFGIYDRCCHAQIRNNTITNTKNQSGIYVISYQPFGQYIVHFNCEGNITNNSISNNNHYGVHFDSVWQRPWVIELEVKNNTITHNNWSGLAIIGGLDNNNNQRSPFPDIGFNNISYNNQYGILTRFALAFRIWENDVSWNGQSGFVLRNSSKPNVFYNNASNNFENGFDVRGGSTPNIHENNVFNNNHSGIYGQGGDTNFRITNNELFSNNWAGIELNNSGCRIQSNNINNNSQNGIKISRGSPTINNNNLMIYNNWNGMACYQNAQPVIANNQLKFNSMNGLFIDSANPRTGSNENIISNNLMNGVSAENGAGGSVMARIANNNLAGILTAGAGTDTVFINSNITGNGENGVNATTNSAPEIVNSTIQDDNIGYAFSCSGSADPVALNTMFNELDVEFLDSQSILTRQWFVNLLTISDADSSVVPNVRVWINSTTQTGANPLWTGFTNFNGQRNWLRIIDYRENSGGQTQYSPVDITGDVFNYRTTHVLPNPTIDHTQTITIRLLPNNPPFKASNIKPFKTHELRPTITWDHAIDPDAHTVGYRIWIGTFENTSNVFAHNTPLIYDNSFDLTADLEHNAMTGNKTYHITIVANDQHGGESFAFQTMHLINQRPSKPVISLDVPEEPTMLLKSVTCTITNISIDPDGDEVTYTYKWYKNGKVQSSLTKSDTTDLDHTISIYAFDIDFEKNDIWEVKVYANDGIGFNNMVQQNAVFTIGNVGPEIATELDDIEMEEDQKRMNVIDLTEAFSDIDETGDLTYIIKVNEVNLTVNQDPVTHEVDIIPAKDWNGEAKINFTCYDSEGLWATQTIKVRVTPVNDKPEFVTIGGQPWRPGGTISLTEDDAAIEGKWFNFTVTGTDIDIIRGEDDELTFQVSDTQNILLTHSDTDPLNAQLSFFPTNDDVGMFEFTISIKDSDSKSYIHETTIEIEVKNVNDKPEILSIGRYPTGDSFEFPVSKILDLSSYIDLKQDDVLTLLVTALDPDLEHDDDILTFHTDAIDIIEVDAATGMDHTAKIIITPIWNNIGILKFNITVKDALLETDSVQIILMVKNVNDKPIASIDLPAVPNKIYEPQDEIILEGTANDFDLAYGDELTYTWSSDADGVLGYGEKLTVSNLSIGKHFITLTVEDSNGELNSNSTTVIIREEELPPEEKPEKKEEDDWFFVIALIVMVVIIVVMLLILFLVLRSKRKSAEQAGGELPKKPFEYQRPGEVAGAGPDVTGTGTPGVVKPPTQFVPASQGIPQQLPETGPGAQGGQGGSVRVPGDGATTDIQQPQAKPMVPPQVTTCPKCNTLMTFAPDGSAFCIVCGYTPEK